MGLMKTNLRETVADAKANRTALGPGVFVTWTHSNCSFCSAGLDQRKNQDAPKALRDPCLPVPSESSSRPSQFLGVFCFLYLAVCQNRFGIPFWGRCTRFRTCFGGDWDVHWGNDLDFDPWPFNPIKAFLVWPEKPSGATTR